MTIEIISCLISTKVWDQAGVELATHGSAVKHVPAARQITDCTSRQDAFVTNFVCMQLVSKSHELAHFSSKAIKHWIGLLPEVFEMSLHKYYVSII